jgi:transcription antitermination factor NusA-like protein
MKLSKLQDRIPELDKTTLLHALDVDGDLALVMGKGDHDILRKNHGIFRNLEKEVGRKLWIVEGETSDRQVLEDIFFPIKILMVNVVWLPDGSKLTKVIVPGRKTKRFPLNLEQVKSVVKAVRGIDLIVEFERP